MAKLQFLDYTGLSSFLDKVKDYISTQVTKENLQIENVENKSSETIRGELTYNDVVNGLGYIPAEASDLSVYKFEIANGILTLSYPDDSPAPDVHIDTSGNLIWSYVD